MDVPVGEPARRIRRAELPERVPGLLRYAARRRVADIMHEHDVPQACHGERIEDPAGLLAILQSDIPRQDAAAGIVRFEYGEAQPVTVAPAAVLAREPPGRVALAGRPGPALRPSGQRGPERAFARS